MASTRRKFGPFYYTVKGIIAAVGSKRPGDLIALDIPAIVKAWERNAQSTRYQHHSCLRTILRRLAENYGTPKGLHREVPHVDLPAPRPRTITHAEQAKLMERASMAMRCYVLLCVEEGLRSGTAVKIAPRHYDQETRTISFVTKKQTTQTVPVTHELCVMFNAAIKEGCPDGMPFVVFLSPRRGRKRASFGSNFRRLLRNRSLDTDIRPHDLRRTTAERVMGVTPRSP